MPASETRLRIAQETSRIGALLVTELDFDHVLQRLADEATAACGASLGAMFYSVPGPDGESDLFFALSGAPREAFADLGLPRRTDHLTTTFHGRSLERLADVTLDPRHAHNALHLGIPVKSLSVRSYLALPVSSRSGEVLGRLFFGHPEPGFFTMVHEMTLVGVAAHAAIAMENARLYRAACAAKSEHESAIAAERGARAEAESERARVVGLFNAAPAAIATWRGPEHVFDFANPRYQRLVGRADLLGQPLRGALPHLASQSLLQTFDRVYRTGEPFTGEMTIALDRDDAGTQETSVFRFNLVPVRERGAVAGLMAVGIDVTAEKSAERALREGARRAALGADVGVAMAGSGSLDDQLRRCAEALVVNLDAALARIWTLDEAAQTLVLRASSGLYTHVDGPHGRVPVGALKIGLIAQERAAHLTNDVLTDPRVGDKAWAARERMVAFAGYPLIVDDRVVGVMAMFSRTALGPETLHALAYVADAIAMGIERRSSEEQRTALLAREYAALAQAEAHRSRLHALFMHAPAVVALFRGPEHVFELANGHYRGAVGDARELVGKAIREAMPELASGPIFAALDRVHATGEAFAGTEVRSVFGPTAADGTREEAFFNLVFQPMFDHRNQIDGILQIAFDVTDQVRVRHQAERLAEQLRRGEERYRSLIEATSQTVWITSPEGEMLGEQPGWTALTGQSQEQYQGDGWLDTVHPDDRVETVALWEGAIRAGELFVCEHRLRMLDGAWRYFRSSSAPVREPDGAIREWFGVHADVTEKKLVEVERERLIAELKRSNEDLDQFAYVTSHDLKAPLRGIANLSLWVEEDLAEKISDEGREQMRLLRGRVHRLEALINGILSYSRAGRTRERLELVDLGKLAREVVELLAPAPAVEITLPADLPTIETERVPLQQVLMNLVSNAIKHAKKANPKVSITCSESRDGYSFMVKDNGPGISPAFHQRIWIIFQTLEPRDKVEATGIGLSIVKKIVESRGGRVWIVSVPGAGAEFHFSWPARAKALR
ncbi:MAG: PAS domain-containing protein [Byssovorax sp.]